MSAAAAEDWTRWVGRSEQLRDAIAAGHAQAMQATLDDSEPLLHPGDPLPPLWHWAYFWSLAPTAGLGPDGHAARGGFPPPTRSDERRVGEGCGRTCRSR